MNQEGIPSKRFSVWSRLYARFTLEPFPAGIPPDVLKTIIPTTDADALLRTPQVLIGVTATLGLGFGTLATVPAGERWRVHAVAVDRVTGDRDVQMLGVAEQAGGSGATIDSFTATNAYVSGVLGHEIPVDEGWEFRIDVIGGATDSIFSFAIYLEKEDAF